MSNRLWSALWNVFDNQTRGSFKRMLIASKDHLDKLKKAAETEHILVSEVQFLEPIVDKFHNLYAQADSNQLYAISGTKTVEQLFVDLSGYWIKKWDIAIQNQYMEGTPTYTLLMGERRIPFQSGAYETRISKLKSLAERLADFPSLYAVYEEVVNFTEKIETARTKQQGFEYKISTFSNDLEAARKNLAAAMFGVFGMLKRIYWDNLEKIETFYELQYFTTPNKKPKNNATGTLVTIGADSQKIITSRNLKPNDTFTIEVLTDNSVMVGAVDNLTDTFPFNAQVISKGDTTPIAIMDIAANPNGTANYLLAKNLQQSSEAKVRWAELINDNSGNNDDN